MGMFKITDIRKQRAALEKRRQRLRGLLLWGGGTLVLLTLLVIFVLPPVLRSQLEERLSTRLHRKVLVESARYNPLNSSVVIKGLQVQAKDVFELVSWSRLYVNFNLTALLLGDIEFDEIALSGFSGRVIVQEDGKLSISDLLEQPGEQAPSKHSSDGLILKVDKLEVEGAKFTFEDHSRGAVFVTHLGPLSIKLNDFELHPDKNAPYEFTAATESGERLSWHGRLGVKPFRSSGELSLGGISLPKYAPYYSPFVNFDLLDGRLDVQGNYELILSEDGPRLRLSAGKFGLANFALAKRGAKDPVLAFKDLSLIGIEFDTGISKALVGEIALKGLQLFAVRAKNGKTDLEALLMPKAATPAAGTNSGQTGDVSNAWIQNFRLGKLRVEATQIEVRDEVPRRPVTLGLRDLDLELQGVSLVKGSEIGIDLKAKLAGGAPLNTKGSFCLSPLKANMEWSLEDLPLSGFSPYLEDQVKARLIQGKLSSQGTLQFSQPEAGEPDLSSTAKLALRQLALVDEGNGEPLAGVDAVVVTGIDFHLKGKALAIDEVIVSGPSVSATISKDGQMNFAGLMREGSSDAFRPSQTATEPHSKGPVFALTLGKISIDAGRLSLSDQSVRPEVRFSVRDFGGQINGLDTRSNSSAKVALSGNLEGSGKVLFEGVFYPFGKQASTELKFAVDGLNLVAFSSYSGKYAGYGLSSGRLDLDVKVKLQDRTLESANVMTLDHFTFGESVDSPVATKLPVRLAVALLKDRTGKILVDLPVQGSLDDPEFKVGRVVWRVIGNVLTKAATSPFALLGAAFGGGEELSQIEFEAGGSTLTPASQKKLETLQKALVDRPGLGLSLIGNYDLNIDAASLRTQHLEQVLARAVWQARVGANPNALSVAQAPITPLEREQSLRALYAVNHPAQAAIIVAPAKANPGQKAAKTNTTSPGFFERVVAFFSGRRTQTLKEGAATAKAQSVEPPSASVVAPTLSLEQIVALLESDLTIDESDLSRLGLDRAQAIERTLQEAGVDAARMSVAASASGQARVELQLK